MAALSGLPQFGRKLNKKMQSSAILKLPCRATRKQIFSGKPDPAGPACQGKVQLNLKETLMKSAELALADFAGKSVLRKTNFKLSGSDAQTLRDYIVWRLIRGAFKLFVGTGKAARKPLQ